MNDALGNEKCKIALSEDIGRLKIFFGNKCYAVLYSENIYFS